MCQAGIQYLSGLLHAGQRRNNILASCLRFSVAPNGIAAPCSSPLPVDGTCNMRWLAHSPLPSLSVLCTKKNDLIEMVACTRKGHERGPLG